MKPEWLVGWTLNIYGRCYTVTGYDAPHHYFDLMPEVEPLPVTPLIGRATEEYIMNRFYEVSDPLGLTDWRWLDAG